MTGESIVVSVTRYALVKHWCLEGSAVCHAVDGMVSFTAKTVLTPPAHLETGGQWARASCVVRLSFFSLASLATALHKVW